MSDFASSSSNIEDFTFEYDVFLTISHNKHDVTTTLEKAFTDVGIKAFVDDHMEKFPTHVLVNCRMILVIFTPEFIESDMFLQRLMSIRRCQNLMNKEVLIVFFGLSEQLVREKLYGLDKIRSCNLDLDLGEAALLLDSATAIAEADSLSDLW